MTIVLWIHPAVVHHCSKWWQECLLIYCQPQAEVITICGFLSHRLGSIPTVISVPLIFLASTAHSLIHDLLKGHQTPCNNKNNKKVSLGIILGGAT